MFSKKRKAIILATTFVAVLASSSLVPTVSAQTNYKISNVVVQQNGTDFDLSKAHFDAALPFQIVKPSEIKYFKLENKYYSKTILNAVLGTGRNIESAFVFLVSSDKQEQITPLIGKIENGKLVSSSSVTEEFKILSIE